MNFRNWFWSSPKNRPITRLRSAGSNQRLSCRLTVRRLEDRTVPSVTISVAGATIDEIGRPSPFVTAGSGGLSSPFGITLGPDGNAYVAGNGGAVLRYNGTTGAFIDTFVSQGSGSLAFGGYAGLAFGPDGNLYVASQSTNQVLEYSGSTGGFIEAFVSAGSGGLNLPDGLTFGTDGNLYVCSNGSNAILRYQGPLAASPGNPLPASGQTGATFVAQFVPPSTGGGGPFNLIFGPEGNLYVDGGQNMGVLRYNGTTGALIDTFVPNQDPAHGNLAGARGMAFDQGGRLYVSDASNAVHCYDAQGHFLDDLLVDSVNSSISKPLGMTFVAPGALLITCRDANTVVRYGRGAVVSLSAASSTPVTVDFTTMDGSAIAGIDYFAQSGTVTFAPGQTAREVLLGTQEEAALDGNKTFNVQLSNPTGGTTIANGTATVTIVDPSRQFAVADSSANEGDHTAHYRGAFVTGIPGQGFTRLTFGPDGNIYVATGAGLGSNAIERYNGATGAFIDQFVPANRIGIMGDIVFHAGYLYAASQATNEVLRYDAGTGAFVDAFVTAGSGGINAPMGLAFGPDGNLFVSGRSSQNVVRYDGTTGAPLGTYIGSGSGGLNLPEGLTFDPTGTYLYVASTGSNQVLKYDAQTGTYLGVAASAGVSGPKDVKFGPDGLMYVLSTGNNRILRYAADNTYVDDYVPAGSGGMANTYRLAFGPDGDLYVASSGANSPNQIMRFGTENETLFTVTNTTPSTLPLTVHYATADGTAHAGTDYTATSGTLTFAPGWMTAMIAVPLLADALPDPTSLTFTVNLSNPLGATISNSQAVGTILDNDTDTGVTINQAAGQADPTNASPVTFSVVFAQPVTGFDASGVNLLASTVGGTLVAAVTGTGNSYTVTVTGMAGSGTVVASIPAGAALYSNGDPTPASISTDNTVTFDNVRPAVTVNQSSSQSDPTNTSPITFDVQFSEPVVGFGASSIVLSGTVGGTAAASVQSVTPGAAPNSYVVTVAVAGSHTGTVIASIPAGAVSDPAGNANTASTSTDNTVAFDNLPPSVTITPNPAGTVGGTSVTFDVLFSEAVVGFDATKVDLTGTTAPGATVAVSGTGPAYTVTVSGMTGGGTITAQIDAGVVTDLATNPNLGSGSASVTYVHSGTVQFSAPTYTIDEQGATTLTVTATRTGGSDGALSVNYATSSGTAVAGSDYTGTSGTFNWGAGVTTSQTFTVAILDDGRLEADKAFTVDLSGISVAGALGTPATATVNILETAGLSFSAANYTVNEVDGTATITVYRLFDSHGAVSVNYATSDGSATQPSDYTTTTGTLSWADGDVADKTFTVPLINDNLSEGNEKFNVTLSTPVGSASVGPQATATVTISKSHGTTINGTDKKPQSTFTDSNGDLVTIKFGGKVGTLTYYLTDNKGPISEIDLVGTDPSKSTVSIAVKKPKGGTGDGRVAIGEIDGTGVKSLSLAGADLDGADGAGINLTSFLGSLTIGAIKNGADITLAGAPPAKPKNLATKITAGVIGDGTDIAITGAALGGLTATSIGVGTITAPSVGTINIKGKAKTKTTAAIPGAFKSNLTIAGTGLAAKAVALKSLKVAGTLSNSTILIGGGAGTVGDVGSVSVGSFVNSKLFAGYTGPDDGSGSFNLPSTVGSFNVTGKATAFSRSFVIASNFKSVSLASVDPDNGSTKFGFDYHTALKALAVKSPKFKFDRLGPAIQDMASSDFEVKKK